MLNVIFFIFCVCLYYLFYSCHCTGHFENVALGKDCDQSSKWLWMVHPANYAVNGNTNGTFWKSTNCIHTAHNDTSPWWEVNLGRPYPVYTIIVWARSGHIWRMSERVITVDEVECYRFGQLTNEDPRKQTVNCTRGVLNGTIIRLARDREIGQAGDRRSINLCEFEVISCSTGYWGSGCDQECGECRDGAPCDKVTGHCTAGCGSSVFKPPLCTECAEGRFGQRCSESCSENCADVCDKITGQCTCKAGWKQLTCNKKCEAGSYGVDCSSQCGACSNDIACNHVNGSCDRCAENFALPLCKECADGFHGPNCSQRCSENCVNTSCSRDGGHCACKPGWRPPNCTECSTGNYGKNCSERCGNCMNATDCLPDTGFCTNGCAEGFTGSRCTEVPTSASVSNDGPSRVALIVGSAAGGFALCTLITIVVIVVRRRQNLALRADAPVEREITPTDHDYMNIEPGRGPASKPQDNPGFEMAQGSSQSEHDASNYESVEIYENVKEITNIYTSLH